MGKWSKLKDIYPKMPVDAGYQEKVDAILNSEAPADVLTPGDKKGLAVRDLSDFQVEALYNRARDKKESLEALVSIKTLEIEALVRLLVDRFEASGETSKTFEDGCSLRLADEPFPTVTDSGKLRAWIIKKNMEDMLTLNFQTMKSMVKACLADGHPLPDGVDVFMKTSLTRTGYKPQGQ